MRYRRLGSAGPKVSAIGLGCLAMTGGLGAADEAECVATVRKGLDAGLNLLDTADFYSDGANEELVGRAIVGRRDGVVLATRGGLRPEHPGGPPKILDGRPGSLRTACEASLRRLGVDHIDLYYLGRVDPKVPVEESVGGLGDLVAQGKIRYVGLSEAAPADIVRAHTVHPITALQTEYSLWERHVEERILPLTRKLGIGFVAHTPLGKGFLTGTLTSAEQLGDGDIRRNHPRFLGENFDRNSSLVAEAARVMASTGIPLPQLALAWLLSRGEDVVAIPGTRRAGHLMTNLAAADVPMSEALAGQLASMISHEQVAGSRAPVRR